MSLYPHATIQCGSCRSHIPQMSMYCLLCGVATRGRRRGTSLDPRAVLYWAARELGLPKDLLRVIVLLAPRGMGGREARWMPYHPKLVPHGPKGHVLMHPGRGDPYENFDAFPTMWNRCIAPGWGVTQFTVFITSGVYLLDSQYMVGICFPSSFHNDAGHRPFGQSFVDEHGPLPTYPTKCFALMIGGPRHAVHLIDDGTDVAPISDDLSPALLSDEADRVLVTVTVDTCALTAMFHINSIPVREAPFPLPRVWGTLKSYPFVCLNTVGDSVEWIE